MPPPLPGKGPRDPANEVTAERFSVGQDGCIIGRGPPGPWLSNRSSCFRQLPSRWCTSNRAAGVWPVSKNCHLERTPKRKKKKSTRCRSILWLVRRRCTWLGLLGSRKRVQRASALTRFVCMAGFCCRPRTWMRQIGQGRSCPGICSLTAGTRAVP